MFLLISKCYRNHCEAEGRSCSRISWVQYPHCCITSAYTNTWWQGQFFLSRKSENQDFDKGKNHAFLHIMRKPLMDFLGCFEIHVKIVLLAKHCFLQLTPNAKNFSAKSLKDNILFQRYSSWLRLIKVNKVSDSIITVYKLFSKCLFKSVQITQFSSLHAISCIC